MVLKSKCVTCKHRFDDSDTGYSECLEADNLPDEEYDQYEAGEWPVNCRLYKERIE